MVWEKGSKTHWSRAPFDQCQPIIGYIAYNCTEYIHRKHKHPKIDINLHTRACNTTDNGRAKTTNQTRTGDRLVPNCQARSIIATRTNNQRMHSRVGCFLVILRRIDVLRHVRALHRALDTCSGRCHATCTSSWWQVGCASLLAVQVDLGQICAVFVIRQQCAPSEQIKKRLDVNIVQMGGGVGSHNCEVFGAPTASGCR